MNTIEKIYTNYDGLLEEFSEEVIQEPLRRFFIEADRELAKKPASIRGENPDQ
ncbi:MAG: hypothetical protein ACLSH1_05275 [Clostridia bacterium]